MGFVQLKSRLRHTIKPIFWFFVVVFLLGGIFSFSSYQANQREGGGPKRKVGRVVATVNGQPILRDDLDQYLWRVSREASSLPVDIHRQVLTQWLDYQIDQAVMAQAQKRENIRVSRKELEAKRMEAVDRALQPLLEQQVALAQRLAKEGLTLEQYREKIAMERFGDLALFESEVAEKKLQDKIEATVQVTDQELQDSYTEVKARHILLDPKEMQKRAEAKLDEERDQLKAGQEAAQKAAKAADPNVQKRLDAIAIERQGLKARNWDDEARRQAEELRRQLLAGTDFATLAKANSMDPGSGPNGGDLGSFRRGQMVPEFDQAAFTLPLGQISAVVKSKFGYHLLKVESRKSNLPADFAKNKATYRDQYVQERKSRAWYDYRSKLKDSAQVVVNDPEIQAYRLLDEGGDESRAVSLLEQAIQQDANNAGAMYELAVLRRKAGNDAEALKLLQQAEKVPGAERSAELMFTLGELLEKQKQAAPAIDYYQKASDLTAPVEPQNQGMHLRLQGVFERLGRKDLAKQEADWMDRFMKAQKEQGGMPGFLGGGSFTVK